MKSDITRGYPVAWNVNVFMNIGFRNVGKIKNRPLTTYVKEKAGLWSCYFIMKNIVEEKKEDQIDRLSERMHNK